MSHSLVILESPYGSPDPAGVAANVKYLQRCIRHSVLTCGESPYASHQMLTAALDDCSPEEREVGIKAGFAWRTVAAKTVVYLDRGLSRGMVFGIQDALKVGCPIELRSFAPVTHEVSSRLEVLGLPITQIVEWPEDLNPTPQEQRIVTGVVYEPDVVTSTGDVYSAGAIREACENWNQSGQTLLGGTVLESYTTESDMEVAGQTIKAGSWLVEVKVDDLDSWQQIKNGQVTGFSIGGWAVKVPQAT